MGLAIKRICVAPLAGNLDMVVYLAPWINYNGFVLFGLLIFPKQIKFFQHADTKLKVELRYGFFSSSFGVFFEFCREP